MPLVALALAGAGIYIVGRFVRDEMARIASLMDAADRQPKPIEIRLERDPRTGIYHDRPTDPR